MSFLHVKVLVICFCSSVLSQATIKDHSDDFYWREYNGDVPKDALTGGMDRERNPTYIGQVVEYGSIIPGQIFRGDKKLYFTGDYSARSLSENIKILCTQNPQNFEWIKTNTGSVTHFGRMRLIPGGFQYGDNIYIGRGIAGNMLSVGSVVIPSDPSRSPTFKTVVNGSIFKPGEFDVLAYRLRNPSPSSATNISFTFILASMVVFLLLL